MKSFLTVFGLRLIPCSAFAGVVLPVVVKPCLPCATVIVETSLALTLRVPTPILISYKENPYPLASPGLSQL